MKTYQIPPGSLISYFSNKVKQQGGINLAQGIPGFQPPEELLKILNSCTHLPVHQYPPGNGNIELLKRLAQKHQNFHISLDHILVVQGVTEAITLLYIYFKQILNPGFSAMAFDPVYETYSNIPAIFGDPFVSLPIENKPVDFNSMENLIKRNNVKVFYLASPGNPYGRIFSEEEIQKILELSDKYGFYVVFDAVYQDLYYEKHPYIPFDRDKEKVFYVNSFSKMLSITGWRIGYLICHESHMEKIRSIHDYTGLCAPSILQEAIARYLKKHNFGEEYITELRNKLRSSYQMVHKKLQNTGFTIPRIDGGYFVWTQLPERYRDGFKFAIDLYEAEKVAVIPGIHFSHRAKDFIRLNVAHEQDIIENAVDKIIKFCKND